MESNVGDLPPASFLDGRPSSTGLRGGSSSGRDGYDALDATTLYHNDDYTGHRVPPLHIASQDDYHAGHQYGYASHSTGVSLPGLQYTSPSLAGHISQQYQHESAIQVLEELQAFSPITPNPYNINAYRTPYPDSNATSTSSTTSPDPANSAGGVITDPIIVEADEDKRKRNQAASARFRQKKKQREQQLMETSREMQERTRKLEAENDGLKKENMFLKKLLVEKVDHMSDEDREMLKKATEGTLNVVKKKK